jgi:hypothetical protein
VTPRDSHDPIFTPEGGEDFLREVPEAELHLLDNGRFALEEGEIDRATPSQVETPLQSPVPETLEKRRSGAWPA